MPNLSIDDSKEFLRLRREVFTTIRIRHPNMQRSEAFNQLVRDTISSFARAGVKEAELTRMILVIVQKFVKQLSQ